ncbi:MAG: sigma-54-dependent Fis family transcriptional regulator [Bacteroidales bacterium]|nr:sigma-54-dependent Fis family transcriptional regulator [Bacteroidales bacterium]MBN2763868.1 sigma-54-dependent Fis family transcriptional regulator [Bacteroidales bacterium]
MAKKNGKILIIDDNVQILNSLHLLLKPEFEEIALLRNPNQLPSLLYANSYDIILLDMNFRSGDNSGNEGLFWLSEILKHDPLAVVIMITAYGDINLAVRAIKEGATDFIAKPWEAEKLIVTLKNALRIRNSGMEVHKLQSKQQQLNEDIDKQFRMFRGSSDVMDEIYKTIEKVAQTDANVLIVGENGTGKEVVAREIHKRSKRSSEIFLAVDMGSLSESLFESEMFGHMKGSFTDAGEDRIGRFETASGGTLFLDEIGNLTVPMQGKLLGVLQNREITRLGSNKTVAVDIRLISATNKNPEDLIQHNLFREDLLFRINTIQIELPPLRKRREDIPGLADYFLSQYATKYEKPLIRMNEAAYNALVNYHWSGNIRELKHTIEKAVILCDSVVLKPDDFALRQRIIPDHEGDSLTSLSDIEKNAIVKALEKCKGNISKAARILDISRTTLYAKMKEYGM